MPSLQDDPQGAFVLQGRVVDTQGNPVADVRAELLSNPDGEMLASAISREDGLWIMPLSGFLTGQVRLRVSRMHYTMIELDLDVADLEGVGDAGFSLTTPITIARRITPGFWVAVMVFAGVLLLIVLEKVHTTTVALLGMAILFLVHYLIGSWNEDWRILEFEKALTFINWEVVFLLIGMMIIVSVIEGTGIFQWLAFQSYRISRGHSWLLVLILMLVTAIASALLDNFTTMLLMVPISLQIALAMDLNPAALIIPEVMASNVGGISTLIGTPTNILIGAYAGIGFSGFLIHQTLGVIMALIVMATIVLVFYRHEWSQTPAGISPVLYQRLAENGRIRQPDILLKSGIVFIATLALFVIGERYHMPPAVAAMAGAAAILLWVRPNVSDKIKEVDWTTLVFFMALFILVGAIQEVGMLDRIAQGLSWIVGESLPVAIIVLVFGVGTLSLVIANIPLAAAMLPVASYLSATIPGAGDALYYALSMGAAMGGNGLIISGEANIVTVGIAERAGTPIGFGSFARLGLPVTFATLLTGTLWLLVHFVLLGG